MNKPNARLKAFISHTKRSATAELGDVNALIASVRSVIAATRLQEYFDASDLQPGTDWSEELKMNAASSALLALRTDLYPSREWCQKEVLIAKCNGMPIIILDAIGYAEERGSFLMDHVPRAPIRTDGVEWKRRDVYRALNLLVDECLKRELWKRQRQLSEAHGELAVSWWAPHAPELVTLVQWLETAKADVCLDPEGHVVEWNSGRGKDPQPVRDDALCRQSLTALRNYMASTTNGRVLIGGRRHGFHGVLPGVLEEALISIEHGQPLYLAGGFGGVTADTVTALGIDDGTWLPAATNGPPQIRV